MLLEGLNNGWKNILTEKRKELRREVICDKSKSIICDKSGNEINKFELNCLAYKKRQTDRQTDTQSDEQTAK